ncbi:MAG: tetratricopeptide repeat protein [Gammaproteobacteria bacterium]|jgi:tetratricopeptide (TPR) repeat protein|nr:tetratricopeptide repeat protein [Gammaproteobacteria bacterium]
MRRRELTIDSRKLLIATGIAAALQAAGVVAPAHAQQRAADAFITPSDVVDLIAEGRRRLVQGDPQGALQDFETALARDPNNPQVLYFLGNLYLQLNQIDQGLTYLSRSVELAPDNVRVRLTVAKAYEQFGREKIAAEQYQEVMRRAPGSREAQEAEERNRALSERLRITDAPEVVTESDISALIAEGRRLLGERETAAALRVFKSVLAHQPDNVEMLYFAGNLHLTLNQPVPGIAYLRHAVALAPDLPRLRHTLGLAYERHGLYEDALTHMRAVAQLAPDSAEGGDAAQRIPAIAEAWREQRQQQAIPDMDPQQLEAAGRAALNERRSEDALRFFQALQLQRPDDVEIRYFTGNLQLSLNRAVNGVRDLERATDVAPELGRLRLTLGQAYEQLGAIEAAMREYAKARAAAPDSPEGAEAADREQAMAGRISMLRDDAVILSADVDTLIAEAKRLYNEGDPQGSLRMFGAALLREPENAEALYLSSEIYRALNRSTEAIAYLQRAVEVTPDRPSLRLELARTFEQFTLLGDALREYRIVAESADVDEALRKVAEARMRMLTARRTLAQEEPDIEASKVMFLEVLQDYPDDAGLLGEAVTSLVSIQQVAAARDMLERLVAAQPDRTLPRLFLADVLIFGNDLAAAVTQLSEVVRILPEDHPQRKELELRLANLQGMNALIAGDFAAARDHFDSALALEPDDHGARLNLAAAYHGLGQSDVAGDILRGMVAGNPEDVEARLRLGTLYLESGRHEDAAREFEEVRIRGRGTSPASQASQQLDLIYGSAGGETIRSNVQDRVVEQLRAETDANPDDIQAWSRLGMLLIQLGRSDAAIEAMENMVRINPDNLQTQEGLADMYDRNEQGDKAIEMYHAIAERTPDEETRGRVNEKAAIIAARQSFGSGDNEAAQKGFEEVVARNPDNFIAHFYLAIIYGEQERYRDAAVQYEEVVRIAPNHAAARMSLGIVYEQLNREEDAVAEYRTAVRTAPTDNLRDSAQNRLDTLLKRINGFSYSLNYSTSYASNNNLTASDPFNEFRTDLSGSINYRRKMQDRALYWGLIFSPTYTMYHRTRFDLINYSYTPYLSFTWRDIDFSATFTHSEMEALGTQTAINKSDSISGDIAGDFRMPSLLPWLGDSGKAATVPSNWRLTASGRRFVSASSSIFSSLNRSVSASLSQTLGGGWRWTGTYSFINNSNLELFIGTDFAYMSHGVNMQLSKVLGGGLVANGSYGYTVFDYKNPDSATLFTRYRKNTAHNMSVGLNYFPNERLRMFTNASYMINESNLPTGLILSPEDVGTAIGLQSTSLGDYKNLIISVGVGFSF